MSRSGGVSKKSPHNGVSRRSCAAEFSYGRWVELRYARVSTAQQDLERQIDVLTAVGIAPGRIYLDNKSGATVDRPGLRAVLGFAPAGRCDRGAHPGPAGKDGPRHVEPDP